MMDSSGVTINRKNDIRPSKAEDLYVSTQSKNLKLYHKMS